MNHFYMHQSGLLPGSIRIAVSVLYRVMERIDGEAMSDAQLEQSEEAHEWTWCDRVASIILECMSCDESKCILCGHPAVAVFWMSHGCQANPARVQPLCEHHARKTNPADGGIMELVGDNTVTGAFTKMWEDR